MVCTHTLSTLSNALSLLHLSENFRPRRSRFPQKLRGEGIVRVPLAVSAAIISASIAWIHFQSLFQAIRKFRLKANQHQQSL